jgi:ABC-type amino acid transport substrate-binding protein
MEIILTRISTEVVEMCCIIYHSNVIHIQGGDLKRTGKILSTQPLVILAVVLVAITVVGSAIIMSNIVRYDSKVTDPRLTLSEITGLNATNYPGGDYPNLVDSTPFTGNTYDFACLLSTNADIKNVTIFINITCNDGPIVVGDVDLSYCDYKSTNSSSLWEWKAVVLTLANDTLIGSCPPSWNSTIHASGTDNMNNAFRITYNTAGDYSLFLFASVGYSRPDLLDMIKARGTLLVGTDVPYPPFEYKNLSAGPNVYEGIDMDIAQNIADELGVELEIVPLNFAALFDAINTGQIDIAISAIMITPERSQSVLFSSTYYNADLAVLIADNSNIACINDLNDTTVCAQIGTGGALWVEDNLIPDHIPNYLQFDTVDLAVAAVNNGQMDAAFIDYPIANQYAAADSYEVKISFMIDTIQEYGIAMALGEIELQAAINDILAEMETDGSMQLILEKYNAEYLTNSPSSISLAKSQTATPHQEKIIVASISDPQYYVNVKIAFVWNSTSIFPIDGSGSLIGTPVAYGYSITLVDIANDGMISTGDYFLVTSSGGSYPVVFNVLWGSENDTIGTVSWNTF